MIEQPVHLLARQSQCVELVEQTVSGGHNTAGSNATHLEDQSETGTEMGGRERGREETQNGLAQFIIVITHCDISLYLCRGFIANDKRYIS